MLAGRGGTVVLDREGADDPPGKSRSRLGVLVLRARGAPLRAPHAQRSHRRPAYPALLRGTHGRLGAPLRAAVGASRRQRLLPRRSGPRAATWPGAPRRPAAAPV